MPAIPHTAFRLTALLVPALVIATAAPAQDRIRGLDYLHNPQAAAPGAATPETTGSGIGTTVPRAPVGHRQPTAADVPPPSPSPDRIDGINRSLDRDRSLDICRGC